MASAEGELAFSKWKYRHYVNLLEITLSTKTRQDDSLRSERTSRSDSSFIGTSQTMDSLTEDVLRSDVDAEMTALTPEHVTEDNLEGGDEVEDLRNSLREVVHDDNIRPKMQCLMMDSSFSMVTMQGEDSGIAWETSPSRCTTPWASEAGNPAVDLGSPVSLRPATPGSVPAGRIIFVMDEELMTRRKKEKSRQREEVLSASSDNVSGRPELVEVSRPNVKPEDGEDEEDGGPPVDTEQQLFRLVSEGSEILNILVPPQLETVDEETSKDMEDNLSYLEDSVVPRVLETHDAELGPDPAGLDEAGTSSTILPSAMDPPGAPVARPVARRTAGNVDYFEAFTLMDVQAPGGPAVAPVVEQEQPESVSEVQESEEKPTTADEDKADTISLVEITTELLDEVFYGGTDNYVMRTPDKEDGRSVPARLPSKPSGSTLFGSQEDVLTPIYLPDGPPKIIDQILLEEPKAMAFLYTDLYEEAIGSRVKEEDAESMTSEKSFHSRHSDREARGYLEKYVLIDETPAAAATDVEKPDQGERKEEGPRVLTQDLYEFGDLLPKPEEGEAPNSEEEITDFFRSSGNSSPCDVDPFPRTLEDDEPPPSKTKDGSKKKVTVKVENVAADLTSFEVLPEEPDWLLHEDDDHPVDERDDEQEELEQDLKEMPVAPPRRKVASSPKERLDLTPLMPVEVAAEEEEEEEAGGKEQRKEHEEEEKEAASPAETSGDEGEDTTRDLCGEDGLTERDGNTEEEERHTMETQQTETQEVMSSETEVQPERRQCVIL